MHLDHCRSSRSSRYASGMTGEEIQRNLFDFARRWSLYDGSERAEAQTFFTRITTT